MHPLAPGVVVYKERSLRNIKAEAPLHSFVRIFLFLCFCPFAEVPISLAFVLYD